MGREGCICLFETLWLGKRGVFILELEVLQEGGSSGQELQLMGTHQGYGFGECLRDIGVYDQFFEGTVSFGIWSLNQ